MYDNRRHPDEQSGRRNRHWRALLVVAALALTAAACSSGSKSPGVASAGSSSPTSTSSSSSPRASLLAYSRCMRAHGIRDYPDPDSQGNLGLNAEPGSDLDPNNPRFKAADRACKSLLPPRQAPPAGAKEANLRYARCMRAHGISGFPDPNPDGTLRIEPRPGTNLDPNNPQYIAADNACKHFRPGGGTGGSLQSGGASS
jgi:hypothetical protein